MDQNILNLCNNVQQIELLRKDLKRYDGENCYIEKRLRLFHEKIGTLLNLGVESLSHISTLEIKDNLDNEALQYALQSIKIEDIELLLRESKDLFSMVKSQVTMFEKKQEEKSILGVFVKFDTGLELERRKKRNGEFRFEKYHLDMDDLNYILILSDEFENIANYSDSSYEEKKSIVSKRTCERLGISHPATCYASYH